eukprot:TRINITY_DN33800_c0_g1_i1.p1 TRINITY_DN33800_c0_g1~~TRINITY_DN33800_c0_g1_i1.p1  ORF type:complete len:647 (+),score=225.98 TRINITY_DN33800_c0_g1_i1:46-1941(+)
MEALKPSKLTNKAKYSNVKSKVGSVRKPGDLAMKQLPKPPVPSAKKAKEPSSPAALSRSDSRNSMRSTSKTRVSSASPMKVTTRARTPQKVPTKEKGTKPKTPKAKEAHTEPAEATPVQEVENETTAKPPAPKADTKTKKITLEYQGRTRYPNPLAGGYRPGPLIPARDPNRPEREDDMDLSDDSELPTKTPAKTPMSRASPFAVSPFTESPFGRIRTPDALKVSKALLLSTPDMFSTTKAPIPRAPVTDKRLTEGKKDEVKPDPVVETEAAKEAEPTEAVAEEHAEAVEEPAEAVPEAEVQPEGTVEESAQELVAEEPVAEEAEPLAEDDACDETVAEAEVEQSEEEPAEAVLEAQPEEQPCEIVVPEDAVTEEAAMAEPTEDAHHELSEPVCVKRKLEVSDEEEEVEPETKRRSLSVEDSRMAPAEDELAAVESAIPDFPVSECSSETPSEKVRRHESTTAELIATIQHQGHGTVEAVEAVDLVPEPEPEAEAEAEAEAGTKRSADDEGTVEPSPKKAKTEPKAEEAPEDKEAKVEDKPEEEPAEEEKAEDAAKEESEEEPEEKKPAKKASKKKPSAKKAKKEAAIDKTSIENMTYRQLQQECKKQGIKAAGKKDALVEALLAKLAEEK